MPFTSEELEEMRRADAETDAMPLFVDPWSDELEREARDENKDKKGKRIADYKRRYYEENKEAIADYQRRYYEDEDRREKRRTYMREYMREYSKGRRRKQYA